MTRTGRIFILGLWVVGLVTGVVMARAPDTIPLPSPALSVPLIAALLAELALGPLMRNGRMAPLTINERAIGVIGAGVAAVALSALLGR